MGKLLYVTHTLYSHRYRYRIIIDIDMDTEIDMLQEAYTWMRSVEAAEILKDIDNGILNQQMYRNSNGWICLFAILFVC